MCERGVEITSKITITRPGIYNECRTCPAAAKNVGRALGDNFTHYHGKFPFDPQIMRITCEESGGKGKNIGGDHIIGPCTIMEIKVKGEVEFTNRHDNGRLQNRTHSTSLGVDCPHYFPSPQESPGTSWDEGEH